MVAIQYNPSRREGDAKLIPVDYSDKESIKSALAGIDIVIPTIARVALKVQGGVAEAAKEAGAKLFAPSEFRTPTKGVTEGPFGTKARIQNQSKAVGIPFARIYTDYMQTSEHSRYFFQIVSLLAFRFYDGCRFLGLDVTSGKAPVGGDGNKQISFTSRPDIARYLLYILTRLPAEQLNNRSFTIATDSKVRGCKQDWLDTT